MASAAATAPVPGPTLSVLRTPNSNESVAFETIAVSGVRHMDVAAFASFLVFEPARMKRSIIKHLDDNTTLLDHEGKVWAPLKAFFRFTVSSQHDEAPRLSAELFNFVEELPPPAQPAPAAAATGAAPSAGGPGPGPGGGGGAAAAAAANSGSAATALAAAAAAAAASTVGGAAAAADDGITSAIATLSSTQDATTRSRVLASFTRRWPVVCARTGLCLGE